MAVFGVASPVRQTREVQGADHYPVHTPLGTRGGPLLPRSPQVGSGVPRSRRRLPRIRLTVPTRWWLRNGGITPRMRLETLAQPQM